MNISDRVKLTLLLLCITGTAAAEETIPIYEGLGTYHREIRTASETAQAYFDQGMILAYAFGRSKAVESFRACRVADPEAAICAWGEAWALGPYRNGRMNDEAAAEAYAAIQAAGELSEDAPEVEQALIMAMAMRYADDPSTANRKVLDQAYADAMSEVAERFPDDPDVKVLFAESLYVRDPSYLAPDCQPYPEALEAIEVLEEVLRDDLCHAGACHLYIHAVEPSDDPGRGEACADVLAKQIPLVSHIQHMPSHIYMRIGRYGDAVRANQQAHLVDQMSDLGKAVAIYRIHNVRMMWFAAWMDGQSFVALEGARIVARGGKYRAFDLPQTLARFGLWEELLETKKLPKEGVTGAVWHFARGLAQLRTGDARAAAMELRKLEKIHNRIDPSARLRWNCTRSIDIVRISRGILAGEIAAAGGDIEGAKSELRAAIKVEDEFRYSEPEIWSIPVRQVLGAILLEAGEAERAQQVYEEELQRHPENGWSLFGLAESLRAQGKDTEAEAVEDRFELAWARADILLSSSRF